MRFLWRAAQQQGGINTELCGAPTTNFRNSKFATPHSPGVKYEGACLLE